LVRFPFGLKLDVGNKEMILIPSKSEELYHCKAPRSDLLLENCFEVKNGRKLLIVEGCNIDWKQGNLTNAVYKQCQAMFGISSLGTNKDQLLHRIQSVQTFTNLQYK